MTFPDRKYSSIKDYAASYFDQYERAFSSVDISKLDGAIKLLSECYDAKRTLFVCGNGGSAADAEHFVGELTCTYASRSRGAHSAISLSASPSGLTAWGNDFGFETYFEITLEVWAK